MSTLVRSCSIQAEGAFEPLDSVHVFVVTKLKPHTITTHITIARNIIHGE